MSDTLAIAQSYAATEAVKTQQALATEMLKQQADSGQAVVELLQQSAEQQKAMLPRGPGWQRRYHRLNRQFRSLPDPRVGMASISGMPVALSREAA
jgi:hypothetical protein